MNFANLVTDRDLLVRPLKSPFQSLELINALKQTLTPEDLSKPTVMTMNGYFTYGLFIPYNIANNEYLWLGVRVEDGRVSIEPRTISASGPILRHNHVGRIQRIVSYGSIPILDGATLRLAPSTDSGSSYIVKDAYGKHFTLLEEIMDTHVFNMRSFIVDAVLRLGSSLSLMRNNSCDSPSILKHLRVAWDEIYATLGTNYQQIFLDSLKKNNKYISNYIEFTKHY